MNTSLTSRSPRARRLFLASTVLALAACGGGGGGSAGGTAGGGNAAPNPAPNPAPAPSPAPAPPPSVAVAPMVVGGSGFSLALKADGSVASWGDQGTGQLGNNVVSGSSQRTPQTVIGLSGVKQIAAGEFHAVALRHDGTVVAWGSNAEGKLGIGSIGGTFATPRAVIGLSGIVAIAAGLDHALALRSDGTVWSWGMNDVGQLGLSGAASRATPTQVPGLTNVRAIAAGGAHSLALRDDGAVWAWGWNADAQLGLGSAGNPVFAPTLATALPPRGIVEIAAGGRHSLARTSLDTVLGWGSSLNGQVGTLPPGNSPTVAVPTLVAGLTGVTAISAGDAHSIARLSDGTVRTWGNASSGRLGNGSSGVTESTATPQAVQLSGVTAVAAGFNHSLAVLGDGRVFCFGSNFLSQCGVLGNNLEFATPVEVGPGFRVTP